MTEKTEQATAYKLQKAKEQGQVSKSNELTTSLFFLAMVGPCLILWPQLINLLKTLMRQLLSRSTQGPLSADQTMGLINYLFTKLLFLWLPFALIAIGFLIFFTTAQIGFVWASKAINLDFKRLSITQGLKRIFSVKQLFEISKNHFKIILVFVLLLFSLKHELANLTQFLFIYPQNHIKPLTLLVLKLILQMLSLMLVFAIADKFYSRWKFSKTQRMTKQEVKDEYRQREGDPKIKAKIKQLSQQLKQKIASLERVKTADVVITNPSHLAIALKYERRIMPAPQVVCKGKGELATRIKTIAKNWQVPIIENKTFARALFANVELNHWISREHFPIAAAIFREIYRQQGLRN